MSKSEEPSTEARQFAEEIRQELARRLKDLAQEDPFVGHVLAEEDKDGS